MTNSMIPYSFVPGTKAKASEVNANFISLANNIEQNQTTVQNQISNKADKTELINEFTVNEVNTDLDDYKTKGCYIFSSDYTPLNIPKGDSGMLFVNGKNDSVIKQTWHCNETLPEIFTRTFENSQWSDWVSEYGYRENVNNCGYLKLANGIIVQWGYLVGFVPITYPVAFTSFVSVVVTKQGRNGSYTNVDGGFSYQNLTGFYYTHGGHCEALNWIAIGV